MHMQHDPVTRGWAHQVAPVAQSWARGSVCEEALDESSDHVGVGGLRPHWIKVFVCARARPHTGLRFCTEVEDPPGVEYLWLALTSWRIVEQDPGMLGLGSGEPAQLRRSLWLHSLQTSVTSYMYPTAHCWGTVVVPYGLWLQVAPCTSPRVVPKVSLGLSVAALRASFDPFYKAADSTWVLH